MLTRREYQVLQRVAADRPVRSMLSNAERGSTLTLRRLGLAAAVPAEVKGMRSDALRVILTREGRRVARALHVERMSRLLASAVIALAGEEATSSEVAVTIGADPESVRRALVRVEGRLVERDTETAYHDGHLWRLTEQGERAANGALARMMAEARADGEVAP